MLKYFIGSFYVTIFLTVFAIGSIPPTDLHQIWADGDASIIPSLCQLFLVVWCILTGMAGLLLSVDVSFLGDLFRGVFRFAAAKWRARTALKRLIIFALSLALTVLSACTSSTEIQHDGSGSDLMLKSPCACLPIPYSPPSFQWDGNRPAPVDRGDG